MKMMPPRPSRARALGRATAAGALLAAAIGCQAPSVPEPPALVVLVVVDQLRAELLDRAAPLLHGGFARIRASGHWFSNGWVGHAVSNSAPGHASAATGRHPAKHGIVDNNWAVRGAEGLVRVDNWVDREAQTVGFPDLPAMSPRNRLTDGLADWVARANPESAIITIGLGQSSASSLAALSPGRGESYYYADPAGRYVTSTFFRADYPEWVERFHRETLPGLLRQTRWESSVLPEGRHLARADAAEHEHFGQHVSFPHVFEQEVPAESVEDPLARGSWVLSGPTADEANLAFARAAIAARQLGQRGVTDYLGLNLSALDSVGHWYGPRSLEQLDTVVRLDRALGEFFAHLDEVVGEGRWVLGLTADHGSADIPEYAREAGRPGHRLTIDEMEAIVELAVAAADGAPAPEARAARVAEAIERHPLVADAMTHAELAGPPSPDPFVRLYQRSFRPDRAIRFLVFSRARRLTLADFDVVIRPAEGVIAYDAPANHGSPYEYDRRVPILLVGAGVPAGASAAEALTVDLAPTLAALAGVEIPPDVDGRVLLPQAGRP